VKLARKPVLSVVEGDNCDLMVKVARLWIRPADTVLDTTYGRGAFWTTYRPRRLIISEYDFTALPYGDHFADVVVYDPQYTSTGGNETSTIPDMYDRYAMGEIKGWQNLFDRNKQGMAECARVSAGLLMVKCADFVESGQRRWGHQMVVDTARELGLRQIDEFVLFSGTGPQPQKNLDGSPRRQVHSRRAHSFLCVFRKPRRRHTPL
jgi:hypothetical protein